MEYFFVFVFGTIVGSFLNVVILRHNTSESIFKGGSKCFTCGKNLRWHELIPVISFIIQKRRCRRCGSKMSWQYPIVEILTGLVFVLIFNAQFSIFNEFSYYFLFSTVYYLVIFSLLIAISAYDLRHQIIPNGFVYTFIVLSVFSFGFKNWDLFRNLELGFRNFELWNHFLAGAVFFTFFALIWLLSRGKWMGFGDAKLALGIGFFLGLSKGIFALFSAFWIGSIVGIFLVILLKKRYNMKSSIPFGPFLVLGAFISFLLINNPILTILNL